MTRPRIEVVAAVLADPAGRVLVDQRPVGKSSAGWWEFPGGKLEAGETVRQALDRELAEELGVEVHAAAPMLTLTHRYPERDVLLHAWQVTAWRGDPVAHDGQGLAWIEPQRLPAMQVLPADKPIVDWLRAPDRIAITPAPDADRGRWLAALAAICADGVRMVQLRVPELAPQAFITLAREAHRVTQAAGATLVVNCEPALATDLECDGLHLSAARLMRCAARPIPSSRWLTASAHNLAELGQARELGVDLVLLGPVLPTASHPGATILGWEGFAHLTAAAGLPCYALGGMAIGDLARAQQHGARGIAGISAFF